MRRRTERRREMEQWFAVREAEGLTLRALAEVSGIPVGTLSSWSHRLRREESEPSFAEVEVVDPKESVASEESETPAEVVLREPDGMAIELRGDVAAKVVDAVLDRFRRWS